MSRRVIVAVVLAGIAGTGAIASVRAGERHGWGSHGWGGPGHARWSALSPEDREAFADARIAALHAGMKLTPDQEKLWPPVETAIRDLARQRQARVQARMQARREGGTMVEDAPARLRSMADAATARGEALRKLADATAPLYATLDEGQKRRAMILARPMRPHGGGWHRHGGDRDGPSGPGGRGEKDDD